MLISIITVNYRSQRFLKPFLQSVHQHLIQPKQSNHTFEVVIANNEPEPLELDFPAPLSTRIINHNQNIGFGAANNLAAKEAQGELLLLLNPDVELRDDSLLSMIEHFLGQPDIGVMGPRIILPHTSQPQPWTCGKKISLSELLLERNRLQRWNSDDLVEVDWVSGTALLIKKDKFNQIGGFDERFFMYFEDQDLCLRIKSLGKKIIFYPQANIYHHDGKSWNSHKNKKACFYHSQDHFFRKHHGWLKAWVLKLLRLPIMFMLKFK